MKNSTRQTIQMEEKLLFMMEQLKDEMAKLRNEIELLRSDKIIQVKKKISLDTVSIAEAREILSMSDSGVRRAISDGRLKAYKNKGGRTRVLIDSLQNI